MMKEFDKAMLHFKKAEKLLSEVEKIIKDKDILFHAKRSFHWNYGTYWDAKGEPLKAKKHYWALANELTVKGGEWHDSGNWRHLVTIFENEGKRDSAFYCNQRALITVCDNYNSLNVNELNR